MPGILAIFEEMFKSWSHPNHPNPHDLHQLGGFKKFNQQKIVRFLSLPIPRFVLIRFSFFFFSRGVGTTRTRVQVDDPVRCKSGTDGGEGNTQSGSGKNAEDPGKMPKLEPAKTPKLEPRVQSAIYAAHRLSSSFNNTHTINLILVGTWPRFLWALHYLTFHDVSQALQFFSPGSIDKMSSNPG